MYQIRVEKEFCASHRLINHNGKCVHLHGHNYKVVVRADVERLDECGMGVDFKTLKKGLVKVLEVYDHRVILWDKDPLVELLETNKIYNQDVRITKIACQSSAENLSKIIYKRLFPIINELASVEVFETPTSSVRFPC